MKRLFPRYLMAFLLIGSIGGWSICVATCTVDCTLNYAMGNLSAGVCTLIPDGHYVDNLLVSSPTDPGADDVYSLPNIQKFSYEFCDPVCTQTGEWQQMNNLSFEDEELNSISKDKCQIGG